MKLVIATADARTPPCGVRMTCSETLAGMSARIIALTRWVLRRQERGIDKNSNPQHAGRLCCCTLAVNGQSPPSLDEGEQQHCQDYDHVDPSDDFRAPIATCWTRGSIG